MDGGHAESSMEPQHNSLQRHQFHSILAAVWSGGSITQIKHQSLRTTAEASLCPSEAENKDLLESDRLKEVTNLQKYQDETRSWRDPKVKKKSLMLAT
jgi:hypothetical protein